ncbi:hypothetical protein BDV37DRAFT_243660 [Aspergillus pseudonomiae]|uniref:Uncharacterized protein n=1 Tax=Aspergillus pseudonomiae TaxID=1506151 RepID=A0A5N7DHS0_9EURO|nr:uncharacterized protein BDV37DRAFT_243660 [Aspergillus pseudonomiae]KAE8405980.1 hypothetical protein BDV37DRAFT_243660 [Aspergillus pseudonomiae]
MVKFSKQTLSDGTRVIVRNRVYPDRGAVFKLYSFIDDWGQHGYYGKLSYSRWKRALKSQCGFSPRRHRIRCKLSLNKGSQELIYVSCEKQFVAAIDTLAKNGADLEFEIVHKFEWLHEKVDLFSNAGRRSSRGSVYSDAREKCDLD